MHDLKSLTPTELLKLHAQVSEELRERGVVHATVTAGHAFGGDREATTVEHALALATSELGGEVVLQICCHSVVI